MLDPILPNKPLKSIDAGELDNEEHQKLLEEEEELVLYIIFTLLKIEKHRELLKKRSDVKLISEKVANNLISLISRQERNISPIKDRNDNQQISEEFKQFDNKANKIRTGYKEYINTLLDKITEVYLTVRGFS